MERKLNAELWDKMHYLFRDFNDRMVHVELHYDFEIDVEALKTVLICFLKKRRFYIRAQRQPRQPLLIGETLPD